MHLWARLQHASTWQTAARVACVHAVWVCAIGTLMCDLWCATYISPAYETKTAAFSGTKGRISLSLTQTHGFFSNTWTWASSAATGWKIVFCLFKLRSVLHYFSWIGSSAAPSPFSPAFSGVDILCDVRNWLNCCSGIKMGLKSVWKTQFGLSCHSHHIRIRMSQLWKIIIRAFYR